MIVAYADGTVTENTYNGDGLRVEKTVDGLTTCYGYAYSDVVLEITGEQATFNLRGLNLISRKTGNDTVFFMYNGHGDVVNLTDGGNTVIATYYYDAFGVHKRQVGGESNPYRYSGYMFDEETGLYYLKARYYDPVTSRMLSEDSYRGNISDPLSLNLYTYCANNPIKYFDPTGHYLSPTDKANLSDADQKKIDAATVKYNTAPAGPAGDKQRAEANAEANAIRANAGYSGGTNGGTITVNANTGKTVTVVVENSRTVTNNGNIGTLTVQTGVTSAITNSGTIARIDNSGKITYITNTGTITNINNNGSIGNINNYGTITKITNMSYNGTIDYIYTGSNGNKPMTIQNGNVITSIVTGQKSVVNLDNWGWGTIGKISTGANSTTNITNSGTISSVFVGNNGYFGGKNTGTIVSPTLAPTWSQQILRPAGYYTINNWYGWYNNPDQTEFERNNPIVWWSLLDLNTSWNEINALQNNNSVSVDMKPYMIDIHALANEVRRIGRTMIVPTYSGIANWDDGMSATENVIWASNKSKGGDVISAALAAKANYIWGGGSGDGTYENAKLHAYWNALAVVYTGDAQYVKWFADAHEYGRPGNFTTGEGHQWNGVDMWRHATMDLHNNAVGRDIGTRYDPWRSSLFREIANAKGLVTVR